MKIIEHIPLRNLTMFKTGGYAKYFIDATTDADVECAVAFAKEKQIPFFVLGGGSNILMSDRGFDGMVIHMKSNATFWSEDDTLVVADAGVWWDALVGVSTERDRYGIENLSGIPGSVGGGAGGNIGAYGSEIHTSIEWIEALDTNTETLIRLHHDACMFGYRESIFKREEGKHLIILRVALRLGTSGVLKKEYKDIALYEKTQGEITTLQALRTAVLDIRAKKFPSDSSIGTAGSFFKNPIVSQTIAENFSLRYPEAPIFAEVDGRVKLSAAWIIDHVLHMRGVRVSDVGTWSEQALVLVNYGDATADDVARFAKKIILQAYEATNITLSPEVIYVGEIEK